MVQEAADPTWVSRLPYYSISHNVSSVDTALSFLGPVLMLLVIVIYFNRVRKKVRNKPLTIGMTLAGIFSAGTGLLLWLGWPADTTAMFTLSILQGISAVGVIGMLIILFIDIPVRGTSGSMLFHWCFHVYTGDRITPWIDDKDRNRSVFCLIFSSYCCIISTNTVSSTPRF